MDILVFLIILAETLLALFLLYRSGAFKTVPRLLMSVVLVVIAFSIRAAVLEYRTLDYINFLSQWVEYFRSSGGFSALRNSIGNYNIPYLYFLALFSYSSVPDLYLIKLLSCLFDVLLAWSALLLSRKCGAGKPRQLAAFFAVLLLPTVILNSALWAQCDSIYVSLALLGIYCALDDRPWLSVSLIALSFGFKLQAVFIIPVYAILLFTKRIKPVHLLAFPVVYIILVLPAVIAGRPFKDAILLYVSQASSVGSAMNYNSPSLTAILNTITEEYSGAFIVAAFLGMLVVLIIAFIFRRRLAEDNFSFLVLSLILITLIPFLLPHMHDRYFFGADVLSIIAAVCALELIPAAVLVQFGSLLCYIAYLRTYYMRLGRVYLTNRTGAYAVLIAIIMWVAWLCFMAAQKNSLRSKKSVDNSKYIL